MRFYFESYGCTMNQGEANLMKDSISQSGHVIVQDIEDSDALVLVTCTVIGTTERKMLKRLAKFSETKKPVIVGGCMTTVQKDLILSLNPKAVLVAPTSIHEIVDVVEKIKCEDEEGMGKSVQPHIPKVALNRADTIIPISSGCLGKCTYCITRMARGDLKSRSIDVLMQGIKEALARGYREIRLSSQDNAAYGRDTGDSLPELIERITNLPGDFRVRVGMMNPENTLPIMDDLVAVYENPRVYGFLHVPFQSGSKEILKKMGRKYTITDFFEVVNGFRKAIPDITISTDVIVGFPGEGDRAFRDSVKLVKELKPDILNITRFSGRPGTPAAEMEDQIHSRSAKERSRIMTNLHTEISANINKKFIGRLERALVTEHGTGNTMMGRTGNYKPVVLKENVDIGAFVDVRIIDSSPVYLGGEII